MKQVLLLLLIALFAYSAEDSASTERTYEQVKPRVNVVRNKPNWFVQIDEFGTTVDTGAILNNGGMVSALFTIKPLANDDEWPYAEIMVGLGTTMEQFKTIEITYESNTDVVLKLVQSDMGEDGDETYAYYEMLLPKANWMHTEKVKVKDFVRPDWTPEGTEEIPYNPAHVTEIQIVPDIDEMVGGSATIKVKTLILK